MSFVVFDVAFMIVSLGIFISTGIYNIFRYRRYKKLMRSLQDIKLSFKRKLLLISKDNIEYKPMGSEEHIEKPIVSKKSFLDINQRVKRAEVYFKRGDFETAEKLLVESLALDEDHEDVNKQLALLYMKTEKYPKAELIYLRLFEKSKPDAALYSNFGLVLYKRGRLDMAIEIYKKAIELDPYKASRYASIGQLYYEAGDKEYALLAYQQAHKLDRKAIEYMFILAKLYEEFEQFDQAREIYHKILQLEPYNELAKEALQR